MKKEELELLKKQLGDLLLKEEKEKKHELDLLDNKRRESFKVLSSRHDNAKIGVERYNEFATEKCGDPKAFVTIKPKKIKISPDYEEIFDKNYESINLAAIKSRSITSLRLPVFLELKSLIEDPIDINQYIIDNFDDFYKCKYKEILDKEYEEVCLKIHEKYIPEIEELNKQIELKKKEIEEEELGVHIYNEPKPNNFDGKKLVIGFKKDRSFIFQDFVNRGNILFHADSSSQYPFLQDLLFQYYDKIGEKNLEIILVGDLPTQIGGIAKSLRKASSNPNSISDINTLNDYNNIFSTLVNRVIEKESTYEGDGFFTYNKNNPTTKDPYTILIVNNVSSLSEENKKYLLRIIKDGPHNGIFSILFSDDNYKKSPYSDEEPIVFDSSIYNFIDINCKDELHPIYEEEEIDLSLRAPDFDKREFLSSLSSRNSEDNTYITFNDVMDNNIVDTSIFSQEIIIPAGKTGANIKNITFDVLGSGESFMIIAGKTGSGKSEFLHTLILNSAYLYSPDQLEFYLIDFKDGVEFGPYINKYKIPHIKLVSRKNTIDDALTILQRIQSIFIKRNDLIEKEGCKDIISYNKSHPNNQMPRLFIIIDEYQVLLNGGSDRSETKISSLCENILEDIVKRGRTAGISLILSSQGKGCPGGILSQISHRVVFNSENVLHYFFAGLPNDAEERLSGLPKGSAYINGIDGKEPEIFRSAYIPNSSNKEVEMSKDKIVKIINEKYPESKYPTNIIVSNDDNTISYNEASIQNEGLIDLGISVFDNEHVTMSLSNEEFSNYLIIGDSNKNFDIEAAIINSKYVKSNNFNSYIYCSALSFEYFSANLKVQEIVKTTSDLYNIVSKLYKEMNRRIEEVSQGNSISSLEKSILFINDFDFILFQQYKIKEENESPKYSFLGGSSKTKNIIEMLKEMYPQSYKYGIYLFLHAKKSGDFGDLFKWDNKPNTDYGFYLNKEAINYYLESKFTVSRKIDIESQNSVYVNGDNYTKFKRYKFKEEE